MWIALTLYCLRFMQLFGPVGLCLLPNSRPFQHSFFKYSFSHTLFLLFELQCGGVGSLPSSLNFWSFFFFFFSLFPLFFRLDEFCLSLNPLILCSVIFCSVIELKQQGFSNFYYYIFQFYIFHFCFITSISLFKCFIHFKRFYN